MINVILFGEAVYEKKIVLSLIGKGETLMTAINFLYSQDHVLICMDTLSLDSNRKPFRFTDKIFPIPHLRGVICGTGNVDMILDWVHCVQRNVVADDFSFLNTITTNQLNEISKKHTFDVGTTIYQFGFSKLKNEMQGYVYRSTNEYIQEKYDYCFAKKPQVEFDIYEESENGLEEAFIKLMIKQKGEDDLKGSERVGIGGEIHMFSLSKQGHKLDVIHQFFDYNQCYDEILDNLRSS